MPLTPTERKRLQRQRDREDPDRKFRKLDTLFMFGEVDVAVIIDDNQNIWFRAVDIARALEMDDPNASVSHGIEEKYCQSYENLARKLFQYRDIPGIHPKTTFVNETGMNLFVIRSRMPRAEAFVEWVCGVVLPSIRRTNKYEVEPADNPYKEMNEWLKQQMEELKTRNAAIETRNDTLETRNAALKTENSNLNATNVNITAKFAQDLNNYVTQLFNMKPSCVPPLQDQGKSEYFILYRKYDGDTQTYEMPYYICRVQQNSIDKRYHDLSHEFQSLHKLLELRVPNSVVFLNYIMEQMSKFVERSGSSLKLINGTTEGQFITMIQNLYRTLHGTV